MKRSFVGKLIAASAIALLSASPALAGEPIARDRFVADPSAHVFGDRVYVYATDDSDNDGKYWNSRDWRLYSSADFSHWRDHGQIFSIDQLPWAKGLAWAPTAARRNGHYYLYLPVDRTKIAVARASSPTGPFVDAIGRPLIDNARDPNAGDEPIDPAVLIDDDGRAYLYFGTRVPKVARLARDMTSLSGPIRDVVIRDAKLPYGEAPWVHKRDGLYYFSYSTGWPGQIAYATARSPEGPFTQRGIILDRVNVTTNHHAIVEKDGRWHLFYHDAALPGGGEQRRSIAVADLTYRPDGTIVPVTLDAQKPKPWLDPAMGAGARADAAVAAMTQDGKLNLVFGYATGEQATRGFTPPPESYPGSAGYVPGLPRLGLPPLWESDSGIGVSGVGPAAVKRQRTALPSALAMASTWNPSLVEQGGAMIGREARLSGYNVLLAGSSVLMREPRSGRNFENAGEDPLLNGIITGAAIRGVQSARVISTLKHFAINAQETGRTSLDARIDEAGARVSDYLATQIALERSRPGSVMCAYNKVNGTHSCENDLLLHGMLKGDWGYRGFVMSDWGAVHSTVAAANGGLDQQSGWPFDDERYFGPPLAAAIRAGQVPQSRLDDMARRIVHAMVAGGVVDDPVKPDQPIPFADDAAISRAVAEEGLVLLKNDRNLLPLTASAASVAVIGGHADAGVLSGGGSAQVHPPGGNAVPGLDPTGWPGPVVYIPSSPLKAIARRVGERAAFASGEDIAAAVALARKSAVAIVFATQWTSEGRDVSLSLGQQDALIAAVAAANPNTIVVIESGGPVLMPWLSKAPAVVEAWYPGADGGEAIARLLFGDIDATGRLPISFPRDLADLPRPVLDGADLKDKAPFTVTYGEGGAVGYKWFDSQKKTPLFPFGHGLSYTRFAPSGLSARQQGNSIAINVTVRNAGKRAGAETIQVYASPSAGGWEAPRRLIGFAKTPLQPGEQRTLSMTVDPRLLATWDEAGHRWRIAGGRYVITAGPSSAKLPLRTTVSLPDATLDADFVGPDALPQP